MTRRTVSCSPFLSSAPKLSEKYGHSREVRGPCEGLGRPRAEPMNADRGIAEGFEAAARMLSPSSWAKCCRHRPMSVTVWTPMLLLITASPEVTTLVILTRDRAVRLGDCFRACPCHCVSRPKDDVKQLMDPIRSRAPLSSPRVYSMPNFLPPGCPDTFGVCQVHKHSSGADDSTKEAADVLRFDASTEVFH